MESSPSPGPTTRSSTTSNGAGKAPERSNNAKSFADLTEKLPVIIPLPPVIGELITGALITRPSKTIAKRRPTFSLFHLRLTAWNLEKFSPFEHPRQMFLHQLNGRTFLRFSPSYL